MEFVVAGPPGWKPHSSRVLLSLVHDKPRVPAAFADSDYHTADNNGGAAVQQHGAGLTIDTAPPDRCTHPGGGVSTQV